MKLALSLRGKLLTMLMATSGAAVMLASGATFVYDSRNMLRVMSEDLGSLADIAGANSVAAMAFGDVAAFSLRTEPGPGLKGHEAERFRRGRLDDFADDVLLEVHDEGFHEAFGSERSEYLYPFASLLREPEILHIAIHASTFLFLGFLVLDVGPAGLGEETAVDAYGLSGNKRSVVAEQKLNGRCHVIGSSNAP